jgi:ribosomal protein L11 methyltransferase
VKQSVPLWSIRLQLDHKPAEDARLALEAALEPFGEAMSSFEIDNGKGWLIEVIGQTKPSARDVAAALKPLGRHRAEIDRVPDKDWLAESRKGLPEFRAGPFFFYGSHFKGKVPTRPRRAACSRLPGSRGRASSRSRSMSVPAPASSPSASRGCAT